MTKPAETGLTDAFALFCFKMKGETGGAACYIGLQLKSHQRYCQLEFTNFIFIFIPLHIFSSLTFKS